MSKVKLYGPPGARLSLHLAPDAREWSATFDGKGVLEIAADDPALDVIDESFCDSPSHEVSSEPREAEAGK